MTVAPPRLGLAANRRAFGLLVALSAFVGGMVGLERSVLPLLAGEEFGIASRSVAVSFLITFGAAKAISNLLAGDLASRTSRRQVLIGGWLIGLPVPFILIAAPSWDWILGANVLLGINQGLTWSMTVNMKLDLVGPMRRGLALGLNEMSGYIGVAVGAFLTGIVAEAAGLRPEPFYLGIAFAGAGLAISVALVRDTGNFVLLEAISGEREPDRSLLANLADGTWRRPTLAALSQSGFVTNLNDGMAWALLPLFYASRGLPLDQIAILAAAYPLTWGLLQLPAGWASDRLGRTPLIVTGMLVQGAAIAGIALAASLTGWLVAAVGLGIGTALVYPTLMAAVGDAVKPGQRARALGVYRFWRDLGTVAGALLAGMVADLFGFRSAILTVATLTAASGLVAGTMFMQRAPETRLRSEVGP
ncbi:MAG TPA: MFS transporter [Egibacteraceae bacterium]|nr:MFS transporter [Egibacteraceae bacterium]